MPATCQASQLSASQHFRAPSRSAPSPGPLSASWSLAGKAVGFKVEETVLRGPEERRLSEGRTWRREFVRDTYSGGRVPGATSGDGIFRVNLHVLHRTLRGNAGLGP